MAWIIMGDYLPRSTEAPGERRVFKRLARKASRKAGRVEAAAQLLRETLHDAEDAEDDRKAAESYYLALEYIDPWDRWDSYYDDPYRGLDADEWALVEAFNRHREDRWKSNGKPLTYRIKVA